MFTVDSVSFTKALAAVADHAGKGKDLPELSLILFSVAGDELLVTASNGFTVGIAWTPVLSWDGELTEFALYSHDATLLVSAFARSLSEEATFEILPPAFGGKSMRLRGSETGGLIPGKQITVVCKTDHGRNLQSLWHAVAARQRALRTVPRRTAMNPAHIKLFQSAATIYKEPLIFELGDPKGTLLIRCGANFLGMVSPTDISDTEELYAEYREHWKRRLPLGLQAVEETS